MGAELHPWHLDLLRAARENCGMAAAVLGWAAWPDFDARSRAAHATPALKDLEHWRFVRRLDDGRPIAWVRTPAGTAVLDLVDAAAEREGEALSRRSMVADDLIAVAAFRYALGRQSYIVSHVADWIIANKEALGQHAAGIVRDIDDAERRGGSALGMDMDAECWRRVRAALAQLAGQGKPEGDRGVEP